MRLANCELRLNDTVPPPCAKPAPSSSEPFSQVLQLWKPVLVIQSLREIYKLDLDAADSHKLYE